MELNKETENINIKVSLENGIFKMMTDFGKKNEFKNSTNYLLKLSNVVHKEKDTYIFDPLLVQILEKRYFIDILLVEKALRNGEIIENIKPTEDFKKIFLAKYPNWDYRSWLPNARNQIHTQLRFPYEIHTNVTKDGYDIDYFKITEYEEFKDRAKKHSKTLISDYAYLIRPEHNIEDWLIFHTIPVDVYALMDSNTLNAYTYNSWFKTKEEAKKRLKDNQKIVFV